MSSLCHHQGKPHCLVNTLVNFAPSLASIYFDILQECEELPHKNYQVFNRSHLPSRSGWRCYHPPAACQLEIRTAKALWQKGTCKNFLTAPSKACQVRTKVLSWIRGNKFQIYSSIFRAAGKEKSSPGTGVCRVRLWRGTAQQRNGIGLNKNKSKHRRMLLSLVFLSPPVMRAVLHLNTQALQSTTYSTTIKFLLSLPHLDPF